MNLEYWLIHVLSALMLSIFLSTAACGNSNSDQGTRVDTQQAIYQQRVRLYQAILENENNVTALRNISINLHFNNACLHATFPFEEVRQYSDEAKASVFDTKKKVSVYFGKYQSSAHKIAPLIDNKPWTCTLVNDIEDPTVAVMTYEKYKRIDKVYRMLRKFQRMALTAESDEEAIKAKNHLNYGESCIHFLFGESHSEAANVLISDTWDEVISGYGDAEGNDHQAQYEQFKQLTEGKEKPMPAKDENSCMIFTNVITIDGQ